MVMSDSETGSIWSHLGGDALDGPMKGATMELIPLPQTTWKQWAELHPDTTVLSSDTPYADWYGGAPLGAPGLGDEFIRSIVNWDERLRHNELVLGVTLDGHDRAYPISRLFAAGGVVNDSLAGTAIVVFTDASSAFSSELNGETLEFENVGEGRLRIVDTQTGSAWSFEGRATDGPLAGQQLAFVTSFLTEWYGWSAYHLNTEIFGATEDESSEGNP